MGNKKSRRSGILDCLILDGDRVWHRTAVKLSFARALGSNYGQLPANRRRRESLPVPKSSANRICSDPGSDLAAETLFFSQWLSFRGYFGFTGRPGFTGCGKRSASGRKGIPQGLKPVLFSIVYGPAKAVPWYKAFVFSQPVAPFPSLSGFPLTVKRRSLLGVYGRARNPLIDWTGFIPIRIGLGQWIPCWHLRAVRVKLQVPPLRYLGFPVQEIRVRSGRDDKVEGGGPPWREWRWMDRVEKANLTDFQPSPSTSSGQALRDSNTRDLRARWIYAVRVARGYTHSLWIDKISLEPVPMSR